VLILAVEGGRCRSGFDWYVLWWFVTGKKKKKKKKMKTLVIKRGSSNVERGRSRFKSWRQ
jgi:hypothetical protein